MTTTGIQDGWSTVDHDSHPSAFAMVHRLLRGRYLLTATLAVVCGVGGGLAGFMLQEPLYRSNSIVSIQPQMPKILYDTEQTTAPRMFASYVNTQAELMQSPSVIEEALDSERWSQVRAITGPVTVDRFKASLSAKPDRRSQGLIFVTFEHPDATVARVGNQVLIDAYMNRHGSQDLRDSEMTMGVLQDRRQELIGLRDDTNAQITAIIQAYKTDQLGQLIQAAFENAERLRGEIRTIRAEIDQRQRIARDAEDPAGASRTLTPERAAQIDDEVRNLLITRTAMEARKSELLAAGFLSGHRQMRQVESALEQVKIEIESAMERVRAELARGANGGGAIGSGLSIHELNEQYAVAEQNLQSIEAYQTELADKSIELRSHYAELDDIKKDLAFVEDRITAIDTESRALDFDDEITGKISIANNATAPREPSSDKRIKLAGVGFVGGASLPVGGMLALGLMGRRIRFSDDGILESAHSRIVGVLPDLGKSITDRELAEASAFAVHQIRSQLQILYNTGETSVFAVTSPAPGDGKTSMIIALGLSFAESGDRTLLIDLDLIGRGLSLHFGQPGAPSLADAAASGADLSDMVCDTGFDGLSILPAGMGDELKISRLSPIVVRRLVDMFRDKYDTVLIDSGPILGSIEAGLLSPAVDGMLMVVGRGQLRPLVKRAVDQITSVGGTVAATVFNRASEAELRQSSSSMSVHFSRQASRQASEQASGNITRGGPLAGTLFSTSAARQGASGLGVSGAARQVPPGEATDAGDVERDAS
ncbi:MAG: AAA family ATPase [Planctomycetota bacterium]